MHENISTTRRDVDLLGHVEAVILSLDEEARMDLHDELDRLVDMCKARDPLAVAASWPRNPNVVLTVTAETLASPLVVGTVTNMADIVAEVQRQIALVRAMDRDVEVAQHAIYSTLTDEQQALFRAYEEADNHRDCQQLDLYVLDFGRHLPGLHPAIWAIWRHMFESRQGECCMPPAAGA